MWIVGHTAFTYLLLKGSTTAVKRTLSGRAILFIFVFANILDATHIGFGRYLVHNPIGTFLFSSLWLYAFFYWGLIDRRLVPLLVSAVLCHIITDLLFGGYYFLIPSLWKEYAIFPWDAVEDLITETVLFVAFTIVFFLTKDFQRLKDYINNEARRFSKVHSVQKALRPKHFPFLLFTVLTLFSLAQIFVYSYKNLSWLLAMGMYKLLFLFVMISFAIILISLGRRNLIRTPQAPPRSSQGTSWPRYP